MLFLIGSGIIISFVVGTALGISYMRGKLRDIDTIVASNLEDMGRSLRDTRALLKGYQSIESNLRMAIKDKGYRVSISEATGDMKLVDNLESINEDETKVI